MDTKNIPLYEPPSYQVLAKGMSLLRKINAERDFDNFKPEELDVFSLKIRKAKELWELTEIEQAMQLPVF